MNFNLVRLLFVFVVLAVFGACDDTQEAGTECVYDRDCGSGRYCDNDYCRVNPAELDQDRRRDVVIPDSSEDTSADIDVSSADAADVGTEPPVSDSADESVAHAPTDSTDEPLASLSAECAGFCTALCEFLWECGKEDPSCLVSCGQSARYQALSAAACTEGSHVIGLKECALWLDCGGRACAIDEMCLDLIVSYQCAPICDHTQSTPACPDGDDCSTVADANGSTMSSLGMCWSLF